MTIDISQAIDDSSAHVIIKPCCPECGDTSNVVINKAKIEDNVQTVEFFCGKCGVEFGPFKCDVWTSYRHVPELVFNIRVLGLIRKK